MLSIHLLLLPQALELSGPLSFLVEPELRDQSLHITEKGYSALPPTELRDRGLDIPEIHPLSPRGEEQGSARLGACPDAQVCTDALGIGG